MSSKRSNYISEKENKYKIEKMDKNITSLKKSNDDINKNTKCSEENNKTQNKTVENDKKEEKIKKGLKRSSGSMEENIEQDNKEPDTKKQKQANTLARREREEDSKRLNSRQKQIDYGKNTVGYEKYLLAVPKNTRKKGDPKTPDKYQKCSKRSWDGQIKKWRRQLHQHDPAADKDEIEVNPNELAELEAEEEEIIIEDSQELKKESVSETSSESSPPITTTTKVQKPTRLWSDMIDDEDAWVMNPYSEPIF